MNINALTSAAGGAGVSALTEQTTPTTAGKKSDRDMFMTLLVAQLKNQDPLEPQDGAAFVAQLAQFNSLDQLVGIRQSIEQLNAAIQQGRGQDSTPTNV